MKPWLDTLAAVDAQLDREAPARLSLCPSRARARSLASLGEELLATAEDATREAFAAGVQDVVRAVRESFPENQLWDLDALAASLARGGSPSSVQERAAELAALQRAYGSATSIRFRYVHDFVYGFDWAKWVKRDVPARARVAPFDAPFLAYLAQRARELQALIAEDDETYPALPDGVPRNPFAFSREPLDEVCLLRDLVERGLVPVRAWEVDPLPRWDLAFGELRAARARCLGL